ncbi:FKBP-type peptidyl-prolyl cis-trans isomerase [Plebeiibacterium marinum]|uniref:Peptidyl-prolyl cis-trans isomerase n=1 Tax=Plebeiibacterium marinum TaxID=2992111 RepID=A0AAE3MG38_9BACT|nr:FKBP-type peptidyl-prolyl cis-trans isomerase [Plebeiobacterium marinum]MCW3807086.1 FKBP-type peptidyl-prolyl cis-trans isomerase [Plebeiobacterium marinum]
MARGNKKQKLGGSAGQNRKKSDDFLAQNLKKPNIIETSTGLQYEIIKEGNGPSPKEDSIVIVKQRAMLLGGKILDDTYKENTTMEFKLNETIEGYQEALLMMKVGSRYKFYVPPELGWGKKGSGGRIGPYAVVVFDVDLVEFY